MTIDAALPTTLPADKPGSVEAGYGFSLTDASGFEAAMAAGQTTLVTPTGASTATDLSVFVQPLSALDKQQGELLQSLTTLGKDMSFSEMYGLMTRFGMFSAQVTLMGSIASKTSEGLQQLFRQQS